MIESKLNTGFSCLTQKKSAG